MRRTVPDILDLGCVLKRTDHHLDLALCFLQTVGREDQQDAALIQPVLLRYGRAAAFAHQLLKAIQIVLYLL